MNFYELNFGEGVAAADVLALFGLGDLGMGQSTSIAVVRFKDEYRIVAPTGSWGRFRFRVDAEEAALRLASRNRDPSSDCEVLVQDTFGELTALKA